MYAQYHNFQTASNGCVQAPYGLSGVSCIELECKMRSKLSTTTVAHQSRITASYRELSHVGIDINMQVAHEPGHRYSFYPRSLLIEGIQYYRIRKVPPNDILIGVGTLSLLTFPPTSRTSITDQCNYPMNGCIPSLPSLLSQLTHIHTDMQFAHNTIMR